MTWRKGPADDVATDLFTEHLHTDGNGHTHRFMLADTTVEIPIDANKPEKGVVRLRQITKRDDTDAGRQIHILTSVTDLDPAEAVWRLAARWRQENWFRFGRQSLALDAHDTYRASDDDAARLVPNPAKKTAFKQTQTDRAHLARARQIADQQFLTIATPTSGTSVLTNDMHNQIMAPLIDAEKALAASTETYRAIPTRLPLEQVRPGQQVLDTETKLITHAIRMAVFNTASALARTIKTGTSFARADDEAHNLIRAATKSSGDIDPRSHTLHIRLDPLPTRRQTRAIAELCEILNATETIFPDTNMKLHYTIKTDKTPLAD